MGWELDSPCRSHTYPWQERWSSGMCSDWELEFRDCGVIPGQGLLLTTERWIEGMWGRRSWWEMPVEESQAAMEARQYCWVTHSGWSHHHSLSLSTCQHGRLNNRMIQWISRRWLIMNIVRKCILIVFQNVWEDRMRERITRKQAVLEKESLSKRERVLGVLSRRLQCYF